MTAALTGITKRFGPMVALDGVNLHVPAGQVTALLGANGSGKSTLVKVVTGAHPPDLGTVTIDGRDLPRDCSPAHAMAAGIRAVHQEAPLVDRLNIAENIALYTRYPRRRMGRIAWRSLRQSSQQILDELGIRRSSRDLASGLTAAERAILATGLAVRSAAGRLRLLVLDEATASLPEHEAAPVLARLRQLADKEVAVLLVTHRLGELASADHLAVLSGGRVAYNGKPDGVTPQEIVSIMRAGPGRGERPEHGEAAGHAGTQGKGRSVTGETRRTAETGPAGHGEDSAAAEGTDAPRPVPARRPASAARPTAVGPVLELDGLAGTELRPLSLRVGAGEICGIAGMRGSGLDEFPRVVSGAEHPTAGRVRVGGVTLPDGYGPRQALSAGVTYLPADRLHDGGIAYLPVLDNITLPEAARFWHRRRSERAAADDVIDRLAIQPPDPRVLFGALSGGNQQRVILGRLLRLHPRVLVLADPTYGVDPAARQIIFAAIRTAAKDGIAVLITSTEPEQLAGLCTRVLVLRDGRAAADLSGRDLSADNLMAKALA
jgi:ribose transport system ATP-binding protein